MSNELAIIIPAFKGSYLEETLLSIANQTNKDFIVYIGDDASPDNLISIVNPFKDLFELVYVRFPENLGSVSLAKQWDRCVDLSKNEKYIWLFSDDDIMPSDAVERFYKTIEKPFLNDIFRFNLRFINEKNEFISDITNHPEKESSIDFIKRRLSFSTLSAGCEYIFSRNIFIKHGGFVEFPLAWCSDDATWTLIARDTGIHTIFGNPVLMRMSSGKNISTDKSRNPTKFNSVLLFIKWIKETFGSQISKDEYYRYLQSQINYLSISFQKRLTYIFQFIPLTGIASAIALVINKSKYYRLLNWIKT